MTRKTDKRQNPGARSIRRHSLDKRSIYRGLKTVAERTAAQATMQTALDKSAEVRKKLIKRIERAIRREDIPVAVLHQVAQCIEMWGDDEEE